METPESPKPVPPAFAVGDALSKQFRRFASVVVDKGAMQDPEAFTQLMEGFKVVADQAGARLLAHLLHWRVSSLSEAGKERSEERMLRKRLWTETLFLETTLQLIEACPQVLTGQQAREMEHLAFDWILNVEKYVSINHGDFGVLKDRVVLDAAKLLGTLSPQRLPTIRDRFLRELGLRLRSDSSSPARTELYNLCAGMRFVRLSAGSQAQVEASIALIEAAHPLKHVAQDKKSRVQQCLCDMLSQILRPLVDDTDAGPFGATVASPEVRQRWFAKVSTLRGDILKWANKQSKQVMSAFPLVTALACAESDAQCAAAIDATVDLLHRQLREKKNASMAILCLSRLVHCYARRVRPGLDDRQAASKWLMRTVAPVIQGVARGGTMSQDQIELVRMLVCVVLEHSPDFGMQLLLDLLQVDGVNWEAPLAGLTALLSTLAEVPLRMVGSSSKLQLPANAQGLDKLHVWQPSPASLAQLEVLTRRNVNLFESYRAGSSQRRISQALSKLLIQLHGMYGSSRLTSSRAYQEPPPKDRISPLTVLIAALQCTPFVLPDHWGDGKIFEDLAAYSIHAEVTMRKESIAALKRCLRTLPTWRDQLIAALAIFCLRLPDEHDEVVQDTVALLVSSMQEWIDIVEAEAPRDLVASPQAFASLARLEGCALGLLCSASVKTRRFALELARKARDLHGALSHQHSVNVWRSDGAAGARSEPGSATGKGRGTPSATSIFLADVIDRFGNAIAARVYWDFGRYSDLWRDWRPVQRITFEDCLTSVRQVSDNIRWSRVLCELTKEAWRRCPNSARMATVEIHVKLLAFISVDSAGRQIMVESRLDVARSFCLLVSAAPYMEGSREQEFSTRGYVRLLLTSIRAGFESQQRIAVLALGNASPSCHRYIVQECASLCDDYILDRNMPRSLSVPVPGMSRTHKPKRDDIRLAHANVLRLIASNLQPGSLVEHAVLREKMVQFLSETARYIGSIGELSPELMQLRYALCVVARHCSEQLADTLPKAFGAETRRTFFDMMSMFCEEGAPGQYKVDLRRGIMLAKSRIKDPDLARSLENDINDACDVLEHVAYLGMAAVLKGTVFDNTVRDPKGGVFGWIDRMLSSKQSVAPTPGCWGPSKTWVAEVALRNLLASNVDLARVYVDRCYSRDVRIASGYFKILAEVYATPNARVPLDTYVVVGLVLHKVAESSEAMRTAARGMLNVLLRLGDGAGAGDDRPVEFEDPENIVVGGLSDSYRSFRLQLAEVLAAYFPNVHERLSIDVLRRTRNRTDMDVGVIACLCPWLRTITISPQWRGQWADAFLSLLFDVTSRQQALQSGPIEQVWATLVQERRNVVPVLDYLLTKCLSEDVASVTKDRARTLFVPAKQAVLYVSRLAPRQTIEHLVYEIRQLISFPDEHEPGLQTSDGGKILEFQHVRTSRSYQRLEISPSGEGLPQEPLRAPGSVSAASSEGSRTPTHARSAEAESVRPSPRRTFTKPEVALILLADVACEQDEEFRPHLHVLLHVITICADSNNAAVRRECMRLLVFLLNSLSLKHLSAHTVSPEERRRVTAMIARLQALDDKPTWPRERPTLSRPFIPSAAAVAAFVKEVVDCFFLSADLREKWGGEALDWACTAHSRQFASRSHQVFCALRPTLSSLSCNAMMASLQKCMHNADGQKLDTAVEVLGTLRELLANAEPTKFLLYPQIILVAMSLLNSSVVRIGELAMAILLQALSNVDLGDAMVRNVVVAMVVPLVSSGAAEGEPLGEHSWEVGRDLFGGGASAGGPERPWICIQQLVIKGLFQKETESLALKVLTALNLQIARGTPEPRAEGSPVGVYMSSDSLAYDLFTSQSQVEASPLESVLGNARAGLALGLAASLPFLCVHLCDPTKAEVLGPFIKSCADAAGAICWWDLRDGLLPLCSLLGVDLAYDEWVRPFCSILDRELYPDLILLVVQRMLEVVKFGSAVYQRAAIAIVREMFEGADPKVRAVFQMDANWRVSAALAPYIGSAVGEQVLDVYEAMVQEGEPDEVAAPDSASTFDWPSSIDVLGDCNKLCSESLNRIAGSAGSPGEGSSLEVLPFIK